MREQQTAKGVWPLRQSTVDDLAKLARIYYFNVTKSIFRMSYYILTHTRKININRKHLLLGLLSPSLVVVIQTNLGEAFI